LHFCIIIDYENIVDYIISQMGVLKLDINKYLSKDKSMTNPIFAAINEGIELYTLHHLRY